MALIPKTIFKETWKLKMDWDIELPEEIIKKFIYLALDTVKLLRYIYFPVVTKVLILLVFVYKPKTIIMFTHL